MKKATKYAPLWHEKKTYDEIQEMAKADPMEVVYNLLEDIQCLKESSLLSRCYVSISSKVRRLNWIFVCASQLYKYSDMGFFESWEYAANKLNEDFDLIDEDAWLVAYDEIENWDVE